MKSVIEGKPQYIIYKGRVLQNVLNENRISINEILSEMRAQGVGDISEVYYATIEQNGALSILKKGESNMAHTVIIDGDVMKSNLQAMGLNENWLNTNLTNSNIQRGDVFLMTIDDDGRVNLILKDGKNK